MTDRSRFLGGSDYRRVRSDGTHRLEHLVTNATMSIDAYHAQASISKSGLDDIARCPALWWHKHIDPHRPAEEERAGQLEGNLAHCAILEPTTFDARYHVREHDGRTKEGKAELVEIAERGLVAIKAIQRETALAQRASVLRLPEIAELLSAGWPEVSAFWTDDETGEACRCRPDWVHPVGDDAVILLDVKTYSDASPREFERQVARKRYHVQDAFYSDGYEQASGKRVLGFVFLAVEMAWPYLAAASMLDDEGRNAGRALYRRDLNTYHACCKSGQWPAYGADIRNITLPYWAIQEAAA